MADAAGFGDELIDHMIEAAFLTMGQNCTAGSRVLVHRDIADDVLDRFTAAAQALVIGDPSHPETRIGPLISHAARNRVAEAVDAARAAGARIHSGGLPDGLHPAGAYYPPTVITGAPEGSAAAGTSSTRRCPAPGTSWAASSGRPRSSAWSSPRPSARSSGTTSTS